MSLRQAEEADGAGLHHAGIAAPIPATWGNSPRRRVPQGRRGRELGWRPEGSRPRPPNVLNAAGWQRGGLIVLPGMFVIGVIKSIFGK